MAISFVAASANAAATSGDLSVTPPTTQTDDIMVLAVTSHDNVAVTLPAGWTIYQQGNNTTAMRSTLAWKRAVGVEGAFTVTHTAGDGIVANVAVFRGCATDSTVINASGLTHNASSSTCTATGISTTVAGAMILFTMHDSDNGGSSAQAATDPATLTERFDNASTLGLDEAVSGATALQGAQGATGNATGTLSLGPDVNSGGLTALKPLANVTVALTGVAATAAVGILGVALSLGLTGVLGTGNVGTVTASVGGDLTLPLTGISATGSVGALGPQTSVPIAGSTATGSIGTVSPQTSLAITGLFTTGLAGALSPASDITLTGDVATGAVGSLSPGTATAVTGVSSSGIVGNISAPIVLTGVFATGYVGTVTASKSASLQELIFRAVRIVTHFDAMDSRYNEDRLPVRNLRFRVTR